MKIAAIGVTTQAPVISPSTRQRIPLPAFEQADADDRSHNRLGAGDGDQRKGRQTVAEEKPLQVLRGKEKQDQGVGQDGHQRRDRRHLRDPLAHRQHHLFPVSECADGNGDAADEGRAAAPR